MKNLSQTLFALEDEVERLRRSADGDTGVRDGLIAEAVALGAARQQLRLALRVRDEVELAAILAEIPEADDPAVVEIRERAKRRDK